MSTEGEEIARQMSDLPTVRAREGAPPTQPPPRAAVVQAPGIGGFATFLLLTILAALVAPWFLPQSATQGIAKWEYKIESFSDYTWDKDVIGANAAGADGWEIISARRAGSSGLMEYECILRRRK